MRTFSGRHSLNNSRARGLVHPRFYALAAAHARQLPHVYRPQFLAALRVSACSSQTSIPPSRAPAHQPAYVYGIPAHRIPSLLAIAAPSNHLHTSIEIFARCHRISLVSHYAAASHSSLHGELYLQNTALISARLLQLYCKVRLCKLFFSENPWGFALFSGVTYTVACQSAFPIIIEAQFARHFFISLIYPISTPSSERLTYSIVLLIIEFNDHPQPNTALTI